MASKTVALIMGGAECVFDDIKTVTKILEPDIFVAVNEIGIYWPDRLDHWVSYHPSKLLRWRDHRKKIGFSNAKNFWTAFQPNPRAKQYPGFNYIECKGGSSGFMAMLIGLEHADFAVLAGIPMNSDMRHFHDKQKGKAWVDGEHYLDHWKDNHHVLKDRVRSVSGLTKEMFGFPTSDWLENVD